MVRLRGYVLMQVTEDANANVADEIKVILSKADITDFDVSSLVYGLDI